MAWLSWLKETIPSFRPRSFLIDCSETEAAAIKDVFPQTEIANPQGYYGAKIVVCYYHLFKSVCLQAAKKVRIVSSEWMR
jgi:hypothetical protein